MLIDYDGRDWGGPDSRAGSLFILFASMIRFFLSFQFAVTVTRSTLFQ